jgi:hypothetical protein
MTALRRLVNRVDGVDSVDGTLLAHWDTLAGALAWRTARPNTCNAPPTKHSIKYMRKLLIGDMRTKS